MKNEKDFWFNRKTAQTEETFVLIKPDAVATGASREIIWLLQSLGFGITQGKLVLATEKHWIQHYPERHNRVGFNKLLFELSDRMVMVLLVQGPEAIRRIRKLKKSIRRRWGKDDYDNAIHSSDNAEHVARERQIWGI